MKKFLSLVLSLVMTMSLVTIGAGATEYSDLTDKGEIKYAEAVAVLNKIGIITGYEDGSFKPDGALTRGAAAKIIVSLMIGPEAASSLVAAAAPYSDVPLTNTFASVISYCKTAGYINGYADGTFRPTGALTGYAFAKMLLGALGYDGAKEGFTGSGWTMKVASVGSKAGTFKDISSFAGNNGVTREVACQMALNTLKGTEVEYAGQNVSVSGDNIKVNVGNTLSTPVARLSEAASDAWNGAPDNMLQFVEEHFSALKRVTTSASEDFKRPANQWSYKNVTIGKFAKTPALTFTAAASGDTRLDKIRNLGLDDYDVTVTTKLSVNGVSTTPFTAGSMGTAVNYDQLLNNGGTTNYSKNGTLIEVYTSSTTADEITDIVVIQSYVMQVNSVSSTQVTLKKVESTGMTVTPVTASKNADNYKVLSGLKTDNFVVVTPVKDGSDWKVASVYVPQSATGVLSGVSLNSSGNVNGVTVAGTSYKLSNNWTVEDADGSPNTVLKGTSVNSTQESVVYMDKYGYMIYAEKIAGSSDYIILDEVFVSNVNNRNHNIVAGWDLNGNALSLDFGTSGNGIGSITTAGAVYAYKTSTANNGSYQFDGTTQGAKVKTTYVAPLTANSIALSDGTPFASGVKFLFPTKDGADVTGITVKSGSQAVTTAYTVVLNKDGKVSTVVAANDTDVEVSRNILYVSQETGTERNATNTLVSKFTAYIDGAKTTDCVAATTRVTNDSFYAYSVDANGKYVLSSFDQPNSRSTAVLRTATLNRNSISNKNVGVTVTAANGNNGATNLKLNNATVIDLSGDGYVLGSVSDMTDEFRINNYTVSMIYNDGTGSDKGQVSYIFITDTNSVARTLTVAGGDAFEFSADKSFTDMATAGSYTVYDGQTLYVRSTAAVQKLTVGVGMTLAANPVAAPTAVTDKVVYTATVTGNITANTAATAATNWYTVTVGTAAATAAGITFTASVPTATQIVEKTTGTATVTVTVAGTVAGGTAATGTITMTNCGTNPVTTETTPAAVNMGATANTAGAPTITSGTTNGPCSGVYTIALSGITGNVSVVVSAA